MAASVDLGSRHLHAMRADGVLRVVIDRPERRNALTIEMYHGLKKAAVLAARDPDVDVLLVTATGEWFCVGGEMGGKHEGGAAIDRETDGIDLLPFVQFERCPKIVVMGINGMCQGGGLNMTLTSDLAIAVERATFRAPELLRGVADCFLGARLATRVGIARAKMLLLTAAQVSAREAAAMGLISRVVPDADLEPALAETIARVRETGPQARTALKRDLNRQLPTIDFAMFLESLASEEVREGFAAFVEKRPPRWTGHRG
ncbi:MAG TPA: enoyl-CoA hydratase/isomerase family protein [Candidatus Binatia bacterium]|nr:enoyl-CoA hydratase/isomerase family protein [Candidatus Binatia bacterium]